MACILSHLAWLGEIVAYIEPNFLIQLDALQEKIDYRKLDNQDSVIAIIGEKLSDAQITAYYNIDTYVMEKALGDKDRGSNYCINCYSEEGQTDAINYIKCIRHLTYLSKALNKPLVVYTKSWAFDGTYKCKSLAYKIINAYLRDVACVFINKVQEAREDKETRQLEPLYNDVFYQSISPEEEIYILLLIEAISDPKYFEALGLQYIVLEGGSNMLYGRKIDFDANSKILRPQITADYKLNILNHTRCLRDNENPMLPYYLPPETLRDKGRGVYIGLVTTDDVDYESMLLRRPDGFTRIAGIWEQVRADIGNYYTAQQINTALASPNPGEIISLPLGDNTATMMLAIAGGWNEAMGYRSSAPEAEFLVAKIRVASAELQSIYGGMPSVTGIVLSDAIVAIFKLAAFAAKQGKPLVLIMPFNGNIDAHDASLITQEMLALVARRTGVTLIVPAGEEADKQHHYSIEGEQQGVRRINIRVEQPGQNVVGIIYQLIPNMLTADLYPPGGIVGGPVNLKQPGVTPLGAATIYSSGEQISFLNGNYRTQFRMQNPAVGEWHIEAIVQMGAQDRVEIWISQEALNPFIRLNPFSTLMTIGSNAMIPNVISVGSYDPNTQTVLGSSGRGDLLSQRAFPSLVTYGKSIIAPCRQGELGGVSGTLPAASIMAGAVAALYSKYIEEGRMPLPNTLVMNSIITNVLKQFETVPYPNPRQGFGIFTLEALNELLDSIYIPNDENRKMQELRLY